MSKTSDVLIVTSCSEHETSEAEMSLGAIDAVTAYGLDTTALRVESPPTWPSPPRSLPVGVLLRSNGASALLNAVKCLGYARASSRFRRASRCAPCTAAPTSKPRERRRRRRRSSRRRVGVRL